MLEILYIIVMTVFFFGITIFVHEWGHFIVAKRCGLVIETFSIGMGPAIWKKEIGGIVYKIGAFPIGGYVSLPQLDPSGMEKVQGDNATDREALPDVSPWKKIAVAVAGPFCNIVLAFLLALVVFLAPKKGIVDENGVFVAQVNTNSTAYTAGMRGGDEIVAVDGNPVKSWYETRVECLLGTGEKKQVKLTVRNARQGEHAVTVTVNSPEVAETLINGVSPAIPCKILKVIKGSPAETAGLKADDLIISIDGTMVTGTDNFIKIVQGNADRNVPITIERHGKPLTLTVVPHKTEGKVMIGIQFGGTLSMPWTLSGNPYQQIKSDASSIFRLLKALTTPSESKQAAGGLGGPVAIFTMITIALKMGIINAIGLIRFININLAVLNLLPLPVLDGGHICFALWEGTTRRKVHPRVVATLVNIFAILLITAMVVLSWRDANRNWNIDRFFHHKAAATQTNVVSQTNGNTAAESHDDPGATNAVPQDNK